MHLTRTARRFVPWALILTLGLAALSTGRAQPPDPKNPPPAALVDAKTGAIIVPLNALVSFDLGLKDGPPPTDILVSRDDILEARVDPNNPRKLFLRGKTGGVSQLTVVQKDLPPIKYEVVVQPDLAQLRNLIKRTVPTANVDVQPGLGNVIILTGYVTTPQDADIIARLANSAVGAGVNNVINAIQVGGAQLVQIEVVIASVDRNTLRARGFDFIAPGGSAGGTTFSSIVSGLLTPPSTAGGAVTVSNTANIQLGILPNKFFGALQALRTEGVAKFLAEPKVVTQSGRPAFFRAGGQQAILSGTSGITGPGVQLVPFGTELEVAPIVYGNGKIWLDINPRITAVSQGLGITVGGATSPGFTEQSVRSTVLLESGQTFAIGGLIQNSIQASTNKVPVVGDLPFIGFGFSSVSYQTRESELVIMVTPRLVEALDPCQAPKRLPGMETRTPDDYELFLENILEAPRGQRKVWNGKCYNAAYKCDPTINKYPCAGGVCKGPNGTCLPVTPGFGLPPGGGGPAMPVPLPPIAPTIPPSGTGAAPPAAVPPAELPSVGAAPAPVTEPAPVNLPLPPPPPPVTGAPVPPG
ncbi:type II and III secretion system protein family protein [Frigoriglobus tundricola]|uniref:BON domain-containing protein n=1 Tax=Frigoriglobus tundricola TaxID=2774151 RepID=A0A6M5YLV9_9BACT|nr:BON domain-containing protein [Frigoriglobus tundricola]QJW93962.1 hypothetical protein FTUN_1479 [Frigoriglobus tundricola]